MKKSIILFSLSFTLLFSPLLAAEKQIRVIAEKAPIYTEAHTNSYRIEIVKKGTILTLFTSGSSEDDWYYVSYRSPRWNSRVTGFIQASLVEEVSEPPEIPEEIQPRIEKPKKAPAKVKPKPAKIVVTESIGISSVLASKSYALPESRWEEKSRIFLSIDSKPAAAVHIEKEDKTLTDITKKIPEKLQERQPPEVLDIKEEKPAGPKTEKKQVVPKIEPEKPPRPKKPRIPGEWSLLTMGLGYGPSVGSGFGGFVQLNTKKGVSLHLGAGYYPTTYFYSEHEWVSDEILLSAGIKYYLPLKSNRLRTYVDLQYGGVSVEAVSIITGFWQYQYVYENIQKTLYGPSFLVGIELRLMDNAGLNGAIGLSYNTTEWDYWERDYFLTAEVGLLIYLW
jgi:hypothetical protein